MAGRSAMRTPVGSRLRASASRRTCLRRLEECRSASTPAWIVSNYQLGSSQVAAGPSSNQPALVQTITDSFASPYLLDQDRKSTRLNSSHLGISYAVFCL